MRAIFKYRLPVGGFCTIGIRKGARLLHVDNQHDLPVLWAVVDPDQPDEPRTFMVVATGENFTEDVYDDTRYVGTVLLQSGRFVLHVFEIVGLPGAP